MIPYEKILRLTYNKKYRSKPHGDISITKLLFKKYTMLTKGHISYLPKDWAKTEDRAMFCMSYVTQQHLNKYQGNN